MSRAYSFVAAPIRALLAALALTAAGAASAATLGGALASPTGFVPALRVHAWSRAAGKLYTVDTAAGQSAYLLEVPAGRYVVFATPADPDAPEIYGGHTAFAACARDAARLAAGACTDHALVEVEVGRRRLEGVDVADWSLDDATIAELDAALGRAGGGARSEAELAAPKFSEYPVAAYAGPNAAAIQPAAEPRLERDAQPLAAALAGAPDFAGRYAVVTVACGDECSAAAFVDLASGRVTYPPQLTPLPAAGPCTPRGVLQYRRGSRLLTVTSHEGTQLITKYLVVDPESGALRAVAALANSITERCKP